MAIGSGAFVSLTCGTFENARYGFVTGFANPCVALQRAVWMADTANPFRSERPPGPPETRCRRILAVDGPEIAVLAHRLPNRTVAQLTASIVLTVAAKQPRAVAVALFGMSHDVLDLAEGLARIGYKGRVLALSPPLPNRRLVQRELASQVPGLRLRLVTLAALTQPPSR